MKIQPVVEGHGEVEAVPVLLYRLLREARIYDVEVGRPIRGTRSQLATEEGLTRSVALARGQPNCAAILVLFDGDDDCPAKLGPAAQKWASAAARGVPCALCIAHREYEAWFLATLDSLRHRTIKKGAQRHCRPEVPRNAKGEMERHMRVSYKETIHQPAFSRRFSLSDAFGRCRSFQKLTTSFGRLLEDMEKLDVVWPPPSWHIEHTP